MDVATCGKKDVRTTTLMDLTARIGEEIGVSDWVFVDQAMIDNYAALTDDFGFVHVDAVRAKRSSFGGTIAHGLLTLSMASNIGLMAKSALPEIADRALMLNYGYDRVRFTAPVPCGGQIRARYRLLGIQPRGEKGRLLRYEISVELAGTDKPVMVAKWLLMVVLK